MTILNSALLREKFVIIDKDASAGTPSVVALSNRFVVELRDKKDDLIEVFIVRAHNMHLTLRMAARIVNEFQNRGPIGNRADGYDWEKAWDSIVNDYEYAYNPQRWMAIYHHGKCVFSSGDHHPFLDMIEKCDTENDKDYDYAVPLAEEMLKQTGKNLRVEHDANVALSVDIKKTQARCGIILRGANRTTTFSFSAEKKGETPLNTAQCLGSAAAFLEGVQLAFAMGMNTEKIRIGIIERHSKEEKQTREGKQRLNRLTGEIAALEAAFDVNYRPEKPEFHHILMDAEQLGQKILVPPEDPDEPPEEMVE